MRPAPPGTPGTPLRAPVSDRQGLPAAPAPRRAAGWPKLGARLPRWGWHLVSAWGWGDPVPSRGTLCPCGAEDRVPSWRSLCPHGAGALRAPQRLTEDPALHHLQGQVLAGHLGTQASPRHHPPPHHSLPPGAQGAVELTVSELAGLSMAPAALSRLRSWSLRHCSAPWFLRAKRKWRDRRALVTAWGDKGTPWGGRPVEGWRQDAGTPIPPWCGAQIPLSAS